MECDGAGNAAALAAWLASNGGATATDVCGGVTWTNNFTSLSDDCGATGSATVTFTAEDDCGNTSVTTATFTIEDTTDPVVTCPSNTTVSCEDDNSSASTGVATATDNCDASPTVSESQSSTKGIDPDDCDFYTYTITRTWTADDACGNSSSCNQTITVQDITDPTPVCNPISVTLDGSGNYTLTPADINAIAAGSSDNCTPTASLTYSVSPSTFDCTPTGPNTVVLTVTDICGNDATCNATVTVIDNTPPTITCPPNVTLTAVSGSCQQIHSWTIPTPADACGIASLTVSTNNPSVIIFSIPPTAFAVFPVGTTIVTYKATDNNGNMTTCSFTVLVKDTENPVITGCPSNITQNTAPGTCQKQVFWAAPTASDNCPGVSMSSNKIPGDFFDVGVTTVIYTATDAGGNTTTCTFTVTIIDNEPPAITCPANVSIDCEDSTNPSNTGTATATDNCTPPPTVSYSDSNAPGICDGNHVITRTWLATDAHGNTSTCNQTITITDTDPPSITCPANANIDCTASTDPSNTGTATATDNCSGATVTYTDSDASGNCAGNHVITRTWKATDGCGNMATCTQTITITDTDPPSITCPANAAIDCEDDSSPSNTGTATATDNCSGATVTYSDATAAGICDGNYVITRTWTATDGCGNAATCAQTITVTDITAPVITCPAPAVVDCSDSTDPSNTGTATATDNCSDYTISHSDAILPGGCAGSYAIVRTWTAEDECGNSSSCQQFIIVSDTHGPVITCPANADVDCTESTDPSNTGIATATDDCSGATVTHTNAITSGSCAGNYIITRTWKATDGCGNMNTCNQIITVTDTDAPSITCPANADIDCTESTDPSNTGTASSSDNCSGSTVNYSDITDPGSCDGEYVINRTWTATDDCGNEASCTQIITVTDTDAPTITCPVNADIDCTESTDPSNTGSATATDNCSGATVTHSDVTDPGSCDGEYVINRTWTATDGCGNAATCAQVITVTDTDAPVITCPSDMTIQCDESTDPSDTGTATATDNCSGASITYTDDDVAGICDDEHIITRTWTATDGCGNASSCDQVITIVDTEAPSLTCPPNTTINCEQDPDDTGITGNAIVTDNCDATPDYSYNDAITPGSCIHTYTITRTWTANDNCDNFSSCVQIIEVEDVTLPSITCPSAVTINCEDDPDDTGITGEATASDNCDADPFVTYFDTPTPGNCPGNYTLTRAWLAFDECNNTNFCFQTITVQDVDAPVMTCPASVTIDCEDSQDPSDTGNPIVVDNCDIDPVISYNDNVVDGNCPGNYTIERTWSAIDNCDNINSCVQIITVQDVTDPVITCPADLTVNCDESTDPSDTGSATATDNCGTPVIDHDDNIIAGAHPGEYTIERTWTATDNCGNESTCLQTITVVDEEAPVITCPDDITINCQDDQSPSNTGNPTATDNCDPSLDFTHSDNIVAGSCPDTYTIERTWTATDDCMNSNTCVQLIQVQDVTEPAITCPDAITIDCEDSQDPSDTGNPVVTDNCDASPDITYNDVIVDGNCPGNYTIERTWTAGDNCDNYNTCVQSITVVDITNPVITCPAEITIECDESDDPTDTGFATATDNCDADPAISYNDNIVNGSCDGEYTILRTWTAIDHCDNVISCVQTINVNDVTAPSLTCPADLTMEWPAGFNTNPMPPNQPQDPSVDPLITGFANASDACSFADLTYVDVLDGPNPGDCPNLWTLTRTWTATDDCGNSVSCDQVITLTDFTEPEIDCPSDVNMEWPYGFNINPVPPNTPQDPSVDPNITGIPTATDNCGNPVVTYQDVLDGPNPGDCPILWKLYRTWTATDNCGNIATCVQVINMTDNTDPTIVYCPPMLSMEWPSGFNTNPVPPNTPQDPSVAVNLTGGPAQAIDNCGNPVITFQDVLDGPNPSECPVLWKLYRTWTATDNCGNTSTCVQVIEMTDLTDPTITYCPPDLTMEWPSGFNTNPVPPNTPQDPSVAVNLTGGPAQAIDNCGNPAITYQDELFGPNPGNCPNLWVLVRTWTATDNCGNTSVCTQTITMTDLTPPVITCPGDVTINCEDSSDPSDTGMATATDNCGNPTVTWDDDQSTASCIGTYTITRTWTATDNCDNTSTCVQIIEVEDMTAPSITCPPNTTVDCTSSMSPFVTGEPVVSDNCDPDPDVSFNDNIIDGPCIGTYTIERTFTVIDDCSNFATCLQIIEVEDNDGPFIGIQAEDLTVECDGSGNTAQLNAWLADNGGAVAVDNCGTLTWTNDFTALSDDCGATGSATVIFTATDDCGNTSTTSATFTIEDTTPPDISTGADPLILECDGSGNTAEISAWLSDNGGAIANDACGTVSWTNDYAGLSDDCGETGSAIVTFTATDECGHESLTYGLIIILDTQGPIVTCPSNQTQNLDADCNATLDDYTSLVVASDECSGSNITISQSPAAGTMYSGQQVVSVTMTVTDDCGNQSSCSFDVDLVDDMNPTISCPANAVKITDPGVCNYTAVGTEFDPVVDDNCGIADIEYDLSGVTTGSGTTTLAGVMFQKGVTTVTWTVTDVNGLTATCAFTVTVFDDEPPTFTNCPNNIVDNNIPGNCGKVIFYGPLTATDNCPGSVTIVQTDGTGYTSGQIFPVGTTVQTYEATDAMGNVSTCSFTITIIDNEVPVITGCPGNATKNTDAGQCTAVHTWTAPTASDNCPGVTLVTTHNPGFAFPKGVTTVLYTATDASGNTTTCSFTVTVSDNELPVINNCPSNIVQSTDPGVCTAVVSWTAPTMTDNCPMATMTSTHNPGSTFNKGVTTVVYTATDMSGNTKTCSFTVTVNDTELPVINNCPSNIVKSTDPGVCTAVVSWTAPTMTDNCPMATMTSTHNPGATFNKGVTTVVYTATDMSGNTKTCSFTITVNDTELPVINNCPGNIVKNTDAGVCTAVVSWTAPTMTDNCPMATMTSTHNPGATFNKGVTTVIYTATDMSGNTKTCSFTVTVNDNELPVISGCPGNIVKNTDAGVCSAVTTWTAPTATDNCPGLTFVSTHSSGFAFPKGVTTVTYTATDMSGNTATCSFTVTVNDNELPVINNCPSNISVGTDPGVCNAVVSWTVPTVSDNCPMASLSSTHASGSTFSVGTHTVVYTATDMSGNTKTCSFTVTVSDNQFPTITCPANNMKGVDEGKCFYTVVGTIQDPTGVNDNCGVASVSYTLSGATTGSGSNSLAGKVLNKGVTTVTWKVTDNNGNMTTCSFTIDVKDLEPPKITCPPDVMVITAPGQCSVPASSVSLGSPTGISDNCAVKYPITNNSPGSYPVGITEVKWTVTDSSGNKATCTQKVTVIAYTCGQPIQVRHTDTTSNSAKIIWKAGKCATSYELRYRQEITPGVWGPWSSWTVSSGALEHLFTGLNANKFHHYQIRSKCGTTFSTSINGWFWTLPAFGGTQDRIATIPDNQYPEVPIHITVLPNPAREFTVVMIEGFEKTEKEVTMLDMYGKLVFKVKVLPKDNRLELDLNTLGVHTGIYMIRVSDGQRQKTEQLMIER